MSHQPSFCILDTSVIPALRVLLRPWSFTTTAYSLRVKAGIQPKNIPRSYKNFLSRYAGLLLLTGFPLSRE
jgi:hypothetical protein